MHLIISTLPYSPLFIPPGFLPQYMFLPASCVLFLKNNKNNTNNTVCINKRDKLENWLSDNVSKGDVVLFKGSSKMKLDEIVDNVFGLNTCDQRYIDEAEYIRFSKNEMHFRIFEDYASLAKYTGKENHINIKNKIAGKKIRKIWIGAFANNEYIKSIKIGKEIMHIGSNSFMNCKNIEEIVLGKNVKFIGKNAFYGCSNLKKVTFKGAVDFLGANTFGECDNLNEIVITKEQSEHMLKKLKGIKVNKTIN